MVIVGNVILSDALIENCFACDLPRCKGQCCAGGDRGAPLEPSELTVLEKILPDVKPFLTADGLREIETNGPWVPFPADIFATPVMHDRECAYAFYDENRILRCGIERAYYAGKIEFQKPVSCQLYPIRVQRTPVNDILNYHQWELCEPARLLGQKLQIPVVLFVKPALIRKFGVEWFRLLETELNQIQSEKR